MSPSSFVERLAAARIGETFNQYAHAPALCERLAAYLVRHAEASILLVGEAAGYRGARVSGLPFTSERQLTGAGPAEATATIVHRVLAELGLEEQVLLWNVVPTHPHRPRRAALQPPAARARRSWAPEVSWTSWPATGAWCRSVGSPRRRSARRTCGIPRTVAPRRSGRDLPASSDLPVRRNTILLAAVTAVNLTVLQLGAAVASLTFVLVTGFEALLGLGPAIFLTAAALSALPAGRAMDRFGRVPVIAVGLRRRRDRLRC